MKKIGNGLAAAAVLAAATAFGGAASANDGCDGEWLKGATTAASKVLFNASVEDWNTNRVASMGSTAAGQLRNLAANIATPEIKAANGTIETIEKALARAEKSGKDPVIQWDNARNGILTKAHPAVTEIFEGIRSGAVTLEQAKAEIPKALTAYQSKVLDTLNGISFAPDTCLVSKPGAGAPAAAPG